MKYFNIKCNNEKEFKDVQLYLFNKKYEWLDTSKELYFPNEIYPLYITNHGRFSNKFIWVDTLIKDIKLTHAENYSQSKLRKEKLLKISKTSIKA